METYAAFIAIDWADRQHAVCLYDQSTPARCNCWCNRRRLINDRTRLSNRLTALLKSYFPQVLDWFPDLCTLLVCDFLTRWPTLAAAQKARPATLLQFFRAHHSVRAATNNRRLAELRRAVPLTTDGPVLNSSLLMVKVLVAQLRPVLAARRGVHCGDCLVICESACR